MTADFYDALAPYYHLIYGDWEAAITRQGAALASLLATAGVGKDDPILDAASGIGTQTLGLLKLGYQVTASDISAGAIARLHAELTARGLVANAHVDDLRTLARTTAGSMAAIIACDNAVPHLLSDSEILQALRSCLRCLKPGGTALFSIRDYARIVRKNPDVRPYDLQYDGDTRFLAVQVWEWHGDQYDLRMYLTSESPDGFCDTKVLVSRYYAVSVAHLLDLMVEAGFVETKRIDDVLFQPVLSGRRAYAT